MKVFKFGGASISNPERIKNVANLLKDHRSTKTLIVISAMGKTTNALEKVVKAYFDGDNETALALFQQVKDNHLDLVKYLITLRWQAAENQLKDFFTEVEWMLHDKPVRDYDYYYDQVVCCGELLSSSIVATYLQEEKLNVKWIDVRDIIRTDDNFRDASVNWAYTADRVQQDVQPLFDTYDIVVTQGFIAATDENESITLGREGSDYSAAIFANLLPAESVTIWKDVPAVMSADPKEFADAVNIPALTYTEVIEMAFYGAQVIHPKTIKPLQNKKIPLLVKSFLDPELPGTIISSEPVRNLPPVIVVKQNQVLMHFKSKDFSFVEDKPIASLHRLFTELKMKPNLTQNTAISLLCCFDDHPEKIDSLAGGAAEIFDVVLEKNLELLTVRHYDEATMARLTKDRIIVLEQRTMVTVQMLMRQA